MIKYLIQLGITDMKNGRRSSGLYVYLELWFMTLADDNDFVAIAGTCMYRQSFAIAHTQELLFLFRIKTCFLHV